MSINRGEMLDRLKAWPEAGLAELIFRFNLIDSIASKTASTERAIALIKAVESIGPDAWLRLELLVIPEKASGPTQLNRTFSLATTS